MAVAFWQRIQSVCECVNVYWFRFLMLFFALVPYKEHTNDWSNVQDKQEIKEKKYLLFCTLSKQWRLRVTSTSDEEKKIAAKFHSIESD